MSLLLTRYQGFLAWKPRKVLRIVALHYRNRPEKKVTGSELKDIKSNSRCHVYHKFGHWRSDHNTDEPLKQCVVSTDIPPDKSSTPVPGNIANYTTNHESNKMRFNCSILTAGRPRFRPITRQCFTVRCLFPSFFMKCSLFLARFLITTLPSPCFFLASFQNCLMWSSPTLMGLSTLFWMLYPDIQSGNMDLVNMLLLPAVFLGLSIIDDNTAVLSVV